LYYDSAGWQALEAENFKNEKAFKNLDPQALMASRKRKPSSLNSSNLLKSQILLS